MKLKGKVYLRPLDSIKDLDNEHRSLGLNVCLVVFQSSFSPTFPYYSSFPPFSYVNVYSLPLQYVSFILQGLTVRMPWVTEETEFLNGVLDVKYYGDF